MVDIETLKQQIIEDVDTRRGDWIDLADEIHANPELLFQEYEAVKLLTATLHEHDFEVEVGVADLETAFIATRRGAKDGPTIGILAEYDALAKIGHACGHNLIGAGAVAAGVALIPVLEELPGTVQVIGTPAEEGGAGKIIMANAGVFDDLDAAIMYHPSTYNMSRRGSLTSFDLTMEFLGRPAHAAGSPEKGINALDACISTFNNIGLLRQQLPDEARVHGIITNGGAAVNIIPDYISAVFLVRAIAESTTKEILEKVENCARAGALAAGAEVKLTRGELHYANMVPNPVLADLFDANLESLGREIAYPKDQQMGSTDMGNVSHVVPALHAYVQIAPDEVAGHTPEFRAASASAEGHKGMLDAAKALAMTAVDLLYDRELVDKAWAEFRDYFGE